MRKCSLRFTVFERTWYLFERLGVSVQKKLSSVRTAWDIRLKKLLSVRTAWAIRSEKNLSTVRATEAICSKVNFSRVPSQNHFVASHSRQTMCYSPGHVRYEFCLQTYHIWIVTHLFSFVAIFALKLLIDYRQYRHSFSQYLSFFFSTSFPKIIFFIFTLL